MSATASTPQHPDECPNVAAHTRPRAQGDHRRQRRFRCPSCGFWCLLAPADPDATRPNRVACEPCRRGVGSTAPGPAHVPSTPGHGNHCSCEFCW